MMQEKLFNEHLHSPISGDCKSSQTPNPIETGPQYVAGFEKALP